MSQEEYKDFVREVTRQLQGQQVGNIRSYIKNKKWWVGNLNDSLIKLNEDLNPAPAPAPVSTALVTASKAKRGRLNILKRFKNEKMNADLLNEIYTMLYNEIRLNKPLMEKLQEMTNKNALKLLQESYPQYLPPELVQYLKEINENVAPSTMRIQEIKDEPPSIPIAPPIPTAPPIDPALIRLLDKKNNKDDKKETKDEKEECPYCDCPFGDYNKCKGNKKRPDDYMFEKDGEKVDLGRTIVNVYCGATKSSNVPQEIANTALEVNKAPQATKQQVAQKLGETIKKIDTKTLPEAPPSTEKGAMGFSQADLISRLSSLKPTKPKEAETKKEPTEAELMLESLKARRTALGEPEQKQEFNILKNIQQSKGETIQQQAEEDAEADADFGSGYYKKRRKTRKAKK